SDGIIRFHGVSAQVTGDEIRTWVEISLAEGTRTYEQRLVELRAREATLPARVELIAAAVGSVEPDDFVTDVVSDEREDGSVWIGVRLRRDENPLFGHALDNVVHQVRSGVQGVDYFDTTLWFVSTFDPGEAGAIVAAAAAR